MVPDCRFSSPPWWRLALCTLVGDMWPSTEATWCQFRAFLGVNAKSINKSIIDWSINNWSLINQVGRVMPAPSRWVTVPEGPSSRTTKRRDPRPKLTEKRITHIHRHRRRATHSPNLCESSSTYLPIRSLSPHLILLNSPILKQLRNEILPVSKCVFLILYFMPKNDQFYEFGSVIAIKMLFGEGFKDN